MLYRINSPSYPGQLWRFWLYLAIIIIPCSASAADNELDTSPLPTASIAPDDPNLKFNRLWLEQYSEDYHHREGGAVFGYILRTTLRQWYKSRSTEQYSSSDAENQYSVNMDYNLRISSDRIKIGVKYAF